MPFASLRLNFPFAFVKFLPNHNFSFWFPFFFFSSLSPPPLSTLFFLLIRAVNLFFELIFRINIPFSRAVFSTVSFFSFSFLRHPNMGSVSIFQLAYYCTRFFFTLRLMCLTPSTRGFPPYAGPAARISRGQ